MAKDLFELAREKGVDIKPYLLAGYPPELLREALETYIPPKGFIRELFRGISRGALSLGAGALGIGEAITERIPGLKIIAEKVFRPIRESIQREGLKRVAPSPYEGLAGRVAGTLGGLLPYAGIAVTAPVALPTVTTLTETGAIYTEQPEERRSLLRAIPTGVAVGLLQALPVTRATSRALRTITPIGRVMRRYPLATSMAIEATAFPAIFSAMRPIYEYGTGVALPERTAQDILAEAIVGGLFGIPGGIALRREVARRIEKELPPKRPKAEVKAVRPELKIEPTKPEKEPIIEPEKKELSKEVTKPEPEVKPEEKPEEEPKVTLPYFISVLRKVYFTKRGKLKSAFSKRLIPDTLREDIDMLVSFLKEPSFENFSIDEKLEYIKFAYDFLRGLLKRKQVEPIRGEVENALREVDAIADGILLDYLYSKATERYGGIGTDLVNINLPLIEKVKEHKDLKEGAELFLDYIKQDIDKFLEPSEIPVIFKKEWFPEWKPNVKHVSKYLEGLLRENLPEENVKTILSVMDIDRYAQGIVNKMKKGEYVSWTEIITDFEKDIYNLLRKLEEVPPSPERPVVPEIKTAFTETTVPPEGIVVPARHVTEANFATLFRLHPNVKEAVDRYIRGFLGSRVTDILKMKATLPTQVRAELTKAFQQITSGEKGYLEAIFGRRIGSRLESALARGKTEGKYTEEDLEFLKELKKNPIETLLKEGAEDKLYDLAYKTLSLEDILSIIIYGDIDTRTAIQETGIKAYKRASDYIKKEVLPAVKNWVNKGEDKQRILDELREVKPYNAIEDHLLSIFQDYIERIPNEEFGLSALKKVEEEITKYANTLIKNLRDIKKEERIEAKEARKTKYIELLGNQLHVTLRILKDLPFVIKEREGIVPPSEEVYKRIRDINESYANAFAQRLGVSEIINNFVDWYASFVATSRGHNLETREGQQAFADIKRNVEETLRPLATPENAYSIVPDVLFFPKDLESLNTDRPNGYVILSFGETGEARLLKLKDFLSDTLKEDIPIRRFFTDRLDLVVPEKRKFVIVDAENFRNFLEGKEDLEILEPEAIGLPTLRGKSPIKRLWDTYIKAVVKITDKEKFPKILDLSDEPLNTFAENFDRNIIKTKEELSQHRDVSYFLRNPAEYVKVRLLEMIEASDVNRQIDEAYSKLIEGLRSEDAYYRTIEMAKKDPLILSEPVKMFQFMKSVVAKALGEEVGIIVGNEYSPVVAYMRKALGVPFSGFALRLGDRRYIGIVFGEKSNGLITFGHELYHLIEPLLPETDRRLLYSKFKNTEEIAEAFGNYIFHKYQPPSFLKRIFDKMISIIDRIRNALKGLGFVSAYDIFDKIYAGRLAREYKSPEEIPLAYFTDVWDIAKRIRDDFNNEEFEIAFRTKLSEAQDRFVEFFRENAPYRLREWLQRTFGGKVEAVSKEEREFRRKYFGKEKNPIFRKFYNVAIYPKYHDILTVFHNYYSESVGRVNETTMRPLQEFLNSFENLKKENPELHDIAQKLIWYYNAEGRYPLEFEKEVREMYPDLSASDISTLKDIVDKAKNYYDIEAIMTFSAIFDIGWIKLRGLLNTFEKMNYISGDVKDRLLTMLTHIRTEAHDKLFRLYDYEIKEMIELEITRTKTAGRRGLRRVAINDMRHEPEKLWYQYRDEILKMFGGDPEKYKKEGDLSDLSKEHQEVFRTIEAFMTNNLVKATYTLKGLDESFYTPLVRQNGDYEVRLFVKYTDKRGRQKYVEIGYWDTDRRKSDFAQKNELLKIYKIYKAVKEGLEKEKEVMEFRTEDWHRSEKSLSDFIIGETIQKGKTPDYIIMVGKKPPKAERTIDKMSPYEAFDFIRSLALRTDDPEAQKLLRDVFPQALYSMYADVAYALARRLHRRLLPAEFSQRVIEGYRKDVIDVTKEYHIRMTGSLVNKFFLNRVLEAYESPQLKDLFIEDPELKSLIDKYVEATTAPHVPLASFVYKVRALTACYVLSWLPCIFCFP